MPPGSWFAAVTVRPDDAAANNRGARSRPLIRSAIETNSGGLIVDRKDAPAIALPSEEFANKDSELVACDVECRLAGIDGFYLELDVPGLGELVGGAR